MVKRFGRRGFNICIDNKFEFRINEYICVFEIWFVGENVEEIGEVVG